MLTSTGGFAALFGTGSLWIETGAPGPAFLGAMISTGLGPVGIIAPYELISLYGIGIGPPAALSGEIRDGAFTSSLAGYQVLFDGIAAPLLYAASGQINTVVPRGVADRATSHLQIVTPAGTVDGPTLTVAQFSPGVFRAGATGFAAALNQDGSIDSPSNPAKAGSFVTIFLTGAGAGNWNDGAVVPANGVYPTIPVSAASGSTPIEVQYAGDAPGLVAGVMQINLRLPDSLPSGNAFAFNLAIGGVRVGSMSVAVAQ